MADNTGSKWNPSIPTVFHGNDVTMLRFDSAWFPTNELLARLHLLTGWTIHNAFIEEQPQFEGSFHCENGQTTLDMGERWDRCSYCERRVCEEDVDDDYGECPGCAVTRSNYEVTYTAQNGVEAIVIGDISVHSEEEAKRFASILVQHRTNSALSDEAIQSQMVARKLGKEGG